MNRICFLSPDVAHTERFVDLLLKRDVGRDLIHVVANHEVANHEVAESSLPDAGAESSDFLPAYVRGVSIGSVVGLFAGLTAVAFPPFGVVFGSGAILVSTLAAAGVGGLMSGIAGAAFTNSRLNEFKDAIAAGQLLVLVDLPPNRVQEIESAIQQAEPAIQLMGVEPPTPVLG